jgi:hypothetical protein
VNGTLLPLGLLLLLAPALEGCAIAKLAGAMAQSAEYQKKIEVLAEYRGLENAKTAVLVDADLGLLYENPNLVAKVTAGVSERIRRDVPGVLVLNPDVILAWQYRTPQWNAMSFAEMAAELHVDRVVFIEIYEFRLNPEGNRWLWDGACAATVGVVEADSFSPDLFVQTFEIVSKYPDMQGVTRENATAGAVEFGVLHQFIQRTAWLFHDHIEPKYPDKYQPEADE